MSETLPQDASENSLWGASAIAAPRAEQLRGTRWAYHWSGCVGITSSKILRVQVPAPGLFAPAGYNGRGIGVGTAMGKYLADTVASGNRGDFPFPIETLCREKWPALRSAYYDYGTLALQFIDNRW